MRQPFHTIALLAGVGLDHRHRSRLRPCMANWQTVHAHMVDMEKKVETTQGERAVILELKRMLALELFDNSDRPLPRLHIIDRLHNRICHWRKLHEIGEVEAWLKRQRAARSKPL